jgi:hypothetical protein
MRLASLLLLAAGTLASVLLTPDPAQAWRRRGRCAAPPACCPVAPPTCCAAPGYPAGAGYYSATGYPATPGTYPSAEYSPAPTPTRLPPIEARPVATSKISLADDRYDPPAATVPPGTTVRWVNNGQHLHTVTAAGHWDSGDLKPGQSYEATFLHEGTYEYSCRHHPGMRGVIIVK